MFSSQQPRKPVSCEVTSFLISQHQVLRCPEIDPLAKDKFALVLGANEDPAQWAVYYAFVDSTIIVISQNTHCDNRETS